MKALVDLDVVTYACGFAGQSKKFYVEDETFDSSKDAREYCAAMQLSFEEDVTEEVIPEPVANVLHSVKVMVESIVEEAGADEWQGFLTGDGNFREEVAISKPYKGNRSQAKPYHYDTIRNYLLNHMGATLIEGEEADDALGRVQVADIQANGPKNASTIICTIDKDLDMIPGWHFNWNTKEIYMVRPKQGNRFFLHQMLTGDSTDNIPGIPRVGKQMADNLFTEAEEEYDDDVLTRALVDMVYERYLTFFKKHYPETDPECVRKLALAYMKEQHDLLWISRGEEKSIIERHILNGEENTTVS